MRFVTNVLKKDLTIIQSSVMNPLSFDLCCFFPQNGFDYLLTYSDDPQTVFPRYCVSWMVSSGMFLSLFETILGCM